MRYIVIFLLLSINYTILGQIQQFFNLGQPVPTSKNACLVIKNKSKALQKLPAYLTTYQSVTTIKIVGFNDQNYSLDSLIHGIKSLQHLNHIIFENCDLSSIETSFIDFKGLEKISILKHSSIFENTFFPLLKNNTLKELCIQTNDPEIITDSIYLLPQLKSIQISSNPLFNKPNHSTTIQLKNETTTQNIDIAYFGDFYKPNVSGVKSNKPKTNFQPVYASLQSKLDCIKQPIPGININDTVFSFNPSQKTDFTYKSGSKLSIDRNAFVTQTGENYTGSVKLFYREFRNPVEIMLSGIPMTNTVNGETQVFKSGGMYEINAYDIGNQPLKLVSDTSIKINFALTDTSQNFHF